MMQAQVTRFHDHFDKALELLPDSQTRNSFCRALAVSMSVFLDDDTAIECMEIALDFCQGEPGKVIPDAAAEC